MSENNPGWKIDPAPVRTERGRDLSSLSIDASEDALSAFLPEQPAQNEPIENTLRLRLDEEASTRVDGALRPPTLPAPIQQNGESRGRLAVERSLPIPATRIDRARPSSLRVGLGASVVAVAIAIVVVRNVPRWSSVGNEPQVSQSQVAVQPQQQPAAPAGTANSLAAVPNDRRQVVASPGKPPLPRSKGATAGQDNRQVSTRTGSTKESPRTLSIARSAPVGATPSSKIVPTRETSPPSMPPNSSTQSAAAVIPKQLDLEVTGSNADRPTPTDAPPLLPPSSNRTSGLSPSAPIRPAESITAAATAGPSVVAAPTTPAPSSAGTSDESAVRNLLGRYVTAYKSLNVSAAQAVWPSVDAKALGRAFAALESQEVKFSKCDVSVATRSAKAQCGGTARFVPKVGNRTEHLAIRQWTFEMQKGDDQWTIARVDVR